MIVLQFLVGSSLFLGHGLAKVKDVAGTLAWFRKQGFGTLGGIWAVLTEGVASVLLALGLFPRVMAALILFTMLGAMLFHWRSKDPFKDGWEVSYLYFVAMIAIILGGHSLWGLVLG